MEGVCEACCAGHRLVEPVACWYHEVEVPDWRVGRGARFATLGWRAESTRSGGVCARSARFLERGTSSVVAGTSSVVAVRPCQLIAGEAIVMALVIVGAALFMLQGDQEGHKH